jgi:hypothetical protein
MPAPELKRRLEATLPPEKMEEELQEEPQEIDFPTACIKMAVSLEAIAVAVERMAIKQGAMTEDEATYPRN